MSKDIDQILKEIMKQNKELHNVDSHLSKDMVELKKYIKNIENRTKAIDEKLTQLINIINSLTIFIADEDEDEDSVENEDWTPYDESIYADEDYPMDDDDETPDLGDYNG